MMKTCIACHQKKDKSEFYAHPTHADGLNGRCKACLKAYSKDRYRQHRKTTLMKHDNLLIELCKRITDLETRMTTLETPNGQ